MADDNPIACKYESFNALIKINDPELLCEVFIDQLAPDHSDELVVDIFERFDEGWQLVTVNGLTSSEFDQQSIALNAIRGAVGLRNFQLEDALKKLVQAAVDIMVSEVSCICPK